MNKWCNRCGHEARTFYDVKVLSESHICAECVLELMSTDPTCQDVMQYIKKLDAPKCEICGDVLHEGDEIGEFVNDADEHVVGHVQCGIDYSYQIA